MKDEDLKLLKYKFPNSLIVLSKKLQDSNLLSICHNLGQQSRAALQNSRLSQALVQLEESTKPIKKSMDATSKILNSVFSPEVFERFKSLQETINQVLIKWGPTFQRLQKLPQEYRRVHTYLAKRGWLTNGSFPISYYSKIINLIELKKENEIECLMMQFVREKCDEIETSVTNLWKSREDIIKDAFQAHRQNKYSLSVPVMLAQIDGICFDLFNISFYKDVEKLSKRIKKLRQGEEEGNWYQELIFDLMIMENPIRESTNVQNRKKRSRIANPALSRHGVIHGRHTNYATEVNSLRCILILSYLEFLKQDLAEYSSK